MAAIYMWPPTGGFLNFEYVLMTTDQDWLCRYMGVDFDASVITDFGQIYLERNASVVSCGKTVICDIGSTPRHPVQFAWRGHTFSKVKEGNHGGVNGVTHMMLAGNTAPDNYFAAVGQGPFGQGGALVSFLQDSPYSINPTDIPPVPPPNNTSWDYIADINNNLPGERGYGDAFVVCPDYDSHMISYLRTGTVLVEISRLSNCKQFASFPTNGTGQWGHSPTTGYIVKHANAAPATVWFYQVNPSSLAVGYLGTASTAGTVKAAGFTSNGYFVTLETGATAPGATYRICAYTHSGSTINLVDTMDFIGSTNSNATIQTSRVSGRTWLTTTNGSFGTKVFHVEADTIVLDFQFGYSTASSGYVGNPLAFVEAPLEITSNGFAGIKEKLFECWEMNEIGSVTRVGSMGNQNLVVDVGTVTNRAGQIDQAADFTTSVLKPSSPISIEVRTVDNFSLCLDVVLDTKAADQYILYRGRVDWSVGSQERDFALIYDQGLDRFVFWVFSNGFVQYTVVANNFGSPSTGTNYHIYVEYDKTNDQISIKVNDGTADTTALPLGMQLQSMYHPTLGNLAVGRFSTWGGNQYYLDGYVDCLYWFWDTLTGAEQTWMYNSGASRAFSEL